VDVELTRSALSAWEAVPSGPVTRPDLRGRVSASDRERPLVTGVNGPLMAHRIAVRPALIAVSWSFPILLDSCRPSGRDRCVKAREATACGLALTRWTRPRQLGSEEEAPRPTLAIGDGFTDRHSSRSASYLRPAVTLVGLIKGCAASHECPTRASDWPFRPELAAVLGG
jgi:hypothetical protein